MPTHYLPVPHITLLQKKIVRVYYLNIGSLDFLPNLHDFVCLFLSFQSIHSVCIK